MSAKPDTRLIPTPDTDDPRIVDTGEAPVEGHDTWFRGQVQTALDNREANGAKGFKPWRDVMAKFGF